MWSQIFEEHKQGKDNIAWNSPLFEEKITANLRKTISLISSMIWLAEAN